ncbi:glycoside hydrolase family 2 TIM barrel-domain containing protein [Gracilibacillus timonensis]|uniref:glycoside hydrolase family 2 TIM barrel-domain containing protein n=1 Tax=Gracilibacillus timonensis TaxID=1816696 RepID=UPI000826DC03|nr:glycoside hydrolase family 2 TIM barrel-domain containing protein [Gracilibacillus timonensis]
MLRKELTMDFDWSFCKGDPQDAYKIEFDDSNWQTLNVPHDWSISGPFDELNPSGASGGFLPGGIGWYRKKFYLPEKAEDKKVFIHFDGVYHNSEVWCNGHYIDKRPYGFVGFCYDLTPYINVEKENVIAVRVNNSDQPNCRWYTGSGIYRHVWLTISDPLHIKTWGTAITTPVISEKKATVELETTVTNDYHSAKSFTLETHIYDKSYQLITSESKDVVLNSGETNTTKQSFVITNPRLWSPNSPSLYYAVSRLIVKESVVDEYITSFGIREVLFSSENGMTINGEKVKLKGINLHHDAGSVGVAVPERLLESRLQTLKEIGCNAIRCSHNPPTRELLDLCDQMGFFVIDEIFDKWWSRSYGKIFENWWKTDLDAMILRDRNHPSIIMWSVGNEVEDQGSQKTVDTLKMLVNYVHEKEPSRPVTCAIRPPGEVDDIKVFEEKIDVIMSMVEHMDIASLNYQEQWYAELKKRKPDIIILGSETYPFFRGNKHFYKAFEPINPWFDVAENDYVIGQFLWTGFDYVGEAVKWPNKGWAASIINTCGNRKPLSYFQQSVWREEPMVHIAAFDDSIKQPLEKLHWNAPKMASHWTFPHFTDQMIKIVTFTNCEKVELYLNNELLGDKYLNDFPDRMMTWYLPYKAGTIKAIGYVDNEKVSIHEMETSRTPKQIKLTPDRTTIVADARDVSLVEVSVTDEQGICYPYAEDDITFELKGEGKIIGLDNGNLDSNQSFKEKKRSAFNGKCLVIIQANHNEGVIELNASAQSLKNAQTIINSVRRKL